MEDMCHLKKKETKEGSHVLTNEWFIESLAHKQKLDGIDAGQEQQWLSATW